MWRDHHRASIDYVAAVTSHQRRSLWALGFLFVYYAIDRWVPLGAWNGAFGFPVENDQAILDVIVLAVLIGLFAAVRYEVWPAMILGTALLGLWCYFHLTTWWWPFLRGAVTPGELRFHEQFLANVQLLPRVGDHVPPDGEHLVIDVLVLPATVFTLIATIYRLHHRTSLRGARPDPG